MIDTHRPASPRVVIVGPCASGKSTLACGLREYGFEAVVCSQEHSEISTLWRHSGPDVLVALDVDLETIQARRGKEWPESIYRAQITRLAAARRAAAIIIDASTLDAEQVLRLVVDHLRSRENSRPTQTETQ